MCASDAGHIDVVNALIAHGAHVNAKDVVRKKVSDKTNVYFIGFLCGFCCRLAHAYHGILDLFIFRCRRVETRVIRGLWVPNVMYHIACHATSPAHCSLIDFPYECDEAIWTKVMIGTIIARLLPCISAFRSECGRRPHQYCLFSTGHCREASLPWWLQFWPVTAPSWMCCSQVVLM